MRDSLGPGNPSQMTSRRGGPGRGFQWGETPTKIKVSRSVPCRERGRGKRSGTNITNTKKYLFY